MKEAFNLISEASFILIFVFTKKSKLLDNLLVPFRVLVPIWVPAAVRVFVFKGVHGKRAFLVNSHVRCTW